MSVQKLVSEAEKLLEKGKILEAIAKLKQAITEEPLNQIVVTKLANTFVQNREPLEAAKVFGALAKRLSDAGKSQVAIAIYKQALELSPDDINLRIRFAQECESVGKMGDAFLQAQVALQHFMKRKKYFDAANLMPLLARSQPKDEKIKQAWVDVLYLSQAEQKIVHFLVAMCGPPGVLSQEFPIGGEPSTLSQSLYDGLKKLVPFFPRDPRVAYTMAWTAYRRGRLKEFYHFLKETLRRDPDFSLAILLFARVLAENQKLNEALFVYKCFKERMATDKSADMLTLNRLLEAFIEKNGWIRFIEESGDLLDASSFLKAITGQETVVQQTEDEKNEDAQTKADEATNNLELPPAEIDIGGGGAAESAMDIVLSTGQTVAEASKQQKSAAKESDPMKMQAELIKAAIEATVAGMGGAHANQQSQTIVQPVVLPVIHSAPVLANQGVSAEVVAQAQAAAASAAQQASQQTPPPATPAPAASAEASPIRKDPEETTSGIEFKGESVEFTSLITMGEAEKAALAAPAPVADPQAVPPPVPAAPPIPSPDGLILGAGDATVMKPLAENEEGLALPAADPNLAEPTQIGQLNPAAEEMPAGDEVVAAIDAEDAPAEAQKKKLFNPMAELNLDNSSPSLALENKGDERTQMFSPIDVLDAAKIMHNRELADVDTREIKVVPKAIETPAAAQLGEPKPEVEKERSIAAADKTQWKALKVEGERTHIYSPVEAVRAGSDSRRPMDAPILPARADWKKDPAKASPESEQAAAEAAAAAAVSGKDNSTAQPAPIDGQSVEPPKSVVDDMSAGGDATMIVARPAGTKASSLNELANEGEATRVVRRPTSEELGVDEKSGAIAAEATPREKTVDVPASAEEIEELPAAQSVSPAAAKAGAIIPIPAVDTAMAETPGASEEKVDLGDDLLEGPTRIFTQPTSADKTEHLIKEIKKEMKQKANAYLNIDMLLKKADRYSAKRNYYLARKALRHAQALGAEEEMIKERLRDIRKLEFPEGLYNTISSDRKEKVDTSEVLDRLEQEFDLAQPEETESGDLGTLIEARIEAILSESDPRTILDFGVGLHEMGLFRQAESLLMRLVGGFPEHAFDAYYLTAMAKLGRRDYAGAVSILKRLSSDTGKTEAEKIQIYYALGETFEKMRQPDRSKEFFRKVAEIDANYRNIRHKLEE